MPAKSSVLRTIFTVLLVLFVMVLVGVVGFALTLPKTPETLQELTDPLQVQVLGAVVWLKLQLGLA